MKLDSAEQSPAQHRSGAAGLTFESLPSISVVIPVYNSEDMLRSCLQALRTSSDQPDEIIVVDDGSSDGSRRVAESLGARVFHNSTRSGPAHARNIGIHAANSEIVLFVDADVCVHPESLGLVRRTFASDPGLTAVLGSYDDEPGCRNFLSQYRNLMHAFYHRDGKSEATTFWAGYGAARASALRQLGGFDEIRYRHSAIEDIELGYRMHAAGMRLLMEPGLQGKHLKTWTFFSMLKTDLFSRAIPWGELILSTGHMPDDLNVSAAQRISVALTGLALIAFVFQPVVGVLLLALLTGLNTRFYAFLASRRGWFFAARCIPLHWLYFFYSGLGFSIAMAKRLLRL